MAERIGDAELRVTADASEVERTLEQTQRSAQRHFNWFRRQKPAVDVELQRKAFEAGIKRVREQVKQLGKEEAKPEVDLQTAKFIVQTKIVKREMASLRRAMIKDKGATSFDKWVTSLASVRLQMGAVSLTVRQFVRVLTLLGPIITSLTASLIALTGVLSTGLLGALAAASSALAGAALSFAGVYAAVKPYVAGISAATKASTAYAAQVQKTGLHSEKAEKKLKELNSVMAHVPAESRDAIRAWGELAAKYRQLTRADSRKLVTTSINEGVKTTQKLLPQFAAQVNSTMDTVRQSIQRVGAGLRSKKGSTILDQIMGGFNLALPSLLKGFEQLGAVLGKVLAAAAPAAVSLSVAFERWATALNRNLAPADKLSSTISKWAGYFRDIMGLMGALGRLFATVLGAGAREGDNMVVSLTKAINKLNEFLQTSRGQQGMQKTFRDSSHTVELLAKALLPIAQIMYNITQATRPISNAMLEVTAAAAKIIAKLTEFRGVRLIITALSGAIIGLVVIRKVVGLAFALADGIKMLRLAFTLLRPAIMLLVGSTGIGAIILGLTLLGTALYIAWTKSRTFRDIVTGAFRLAVKAVVFYIDHWLGAFSSLLTAFSKVADAVRKFVPGAGKVADAAKSGASAIDSLRESLRALPDKIDTEVHVKVKLSDAVISRRTGGPQGDGWGIKSDIKQKAGKMVQDKAARSPDFALQLLTSMGSGALGSGTMPGSGLNAFNAVARRFGLQIGSGFRPGAITSSGNLSYHAMGRARDFPGTPTHMMAFARFMVAKFGHSLKELIYTPLGFSIKNGRKVAPYAQADHYDHVHVAMAQGGRMSQKVSKPTTVTYGEEPGHPEYFISTNPRYRARSMGLLASAAADIGMASGGGIGTSSRAEQIFRFFVGKGFTPGQAAAWVGVLSQESGLSTTVRNKNSGATGLAQWLGPRLRRLQGKKNWTSLGTQLNFIMEELHGSENAALKRIKGAKGVSAAVNAITWGFERPGKAEANITNRLNVGRSAYSAFKGKGGSGDGGGMSESEIAAARKKIEDKIERNKKLIDSLHKQARHLPSKGSKGKRADIGDRVAELNAQNRELYKQLREMPKSAKEVPTHGETQTFPGLVQNIRDRLSFAESTQRVFDDITQTGRLENILGFQQAKDRQRLKKVEKALAGKLTKATRERLLAEQDEIHSRIWATAAERVKLRTKQDELRIGAFFAGGRGQAGLDFMSAQAQGTTGLEDDAEVLKQQISYWQHILFTRVAHGDIAGATEAQTALNSAGGSLRDTLLAINQQRQDFATGLLQIELGGFEDAVNNAQYTVDLWDDVASINALINQIPTTAFVAAANGNAAYAQELLARLPGLRQQAQEAQLKAYDAPYLASLALAQLTEGTDDDLLALRGLEQIYQNRLQLAKDMGDYVGIAEQAGNLKGIQDQIKGITDESSNLESQARTLSTARYDLYRNFGSNARITWPTEAGQTSAGPTTVNINMPVNQINDPLTLAKSLAWEASSAF